MGIGGSAEGAGAAALSRWRRHAAQFHPRDDAEEERRARLASTARLSCVDDIVRDGSTMFAATHYHERRAAGCAVHSGGAAAPIVRRSQSGTVRQITAHHRFDRARLHQHRSRAHVSRRAFSNMRIHSSCFRPDPARESRARLRWPIACVRVRSSSLSARKPSWGRERCSVRRSRRDASRSR